MPLTEKEKIAIGVGVGVGGAAAAVGAVVAAPFVLGAVGFTSAGVAAGSFAAGMMSSAAIANGGMIAAGSSVAILQSVGAAGLGVAGTAAVGGAGAAVGATIGGIVGALIPGGKKLKINDEIMAKVKEFKEGKTEHDWIGIVLAEKITKKDLVLVVEGEGNIHNIANHLPADQVMFILYKVTDKEQAVMVEEKEAFEDNPPEEVAAKDKAAKQEQKSDEAVRQSPDGAETAAFIQEERDRAIEGEMITQKLTDARLGASVLIIWTGRNVDKSKITEDDVTAAEKALGDFDLTISVKESSTTE